MIEYLRGVRAMVAAQRDVMLQYLGNAPAQVESCEAAMPVAPAAQVEAAPAAAESPVPVEDAAVGDPMALVLAIVSERTGYPPDTLGPDLDLEADLSIDSIKRIEIVGELASRLGLRVGDQADADTDAMIEELATRKTLRSMVAWLTDRLGERTPTPSNGSSDGSSNGHSHPEPVTTPTPAIDEIAVAQASGLAPLHRGVEPDRYVLEISAAQPTSTRPANMLRHRVAICNDARGIGVRLATLLEARGASSQLLSPGEPLSGSPDALVHLGWLARDLPPDPTPAVCELFERVKEAVTSGASSVLVATGHGGHFGHRTAHDAPLLRGGPAGLVKTVAAEWPGVRARVVDLDPDETPTRLAELLCTELVSNDELVEVGYVDGKRCGLNVVPAPQRGDGRGAGITIDSSSVVLLTGGARGITGLVAIALARRYRCRLELVGRSALPDPVEDPELAGATDAPALRRRLIEHASGNGAPNAAEIEARCRRLVADREIRTTLGAIRAAGSEVAYHSADVRDPDFARLIDDIYVRHGRIDGVIHGAGVLEDKLIRTKTSDSFERVFATKMAGAATLAMKLRRDVRFVVLFSSLSGVLGNRGQVDYAAANDALDKLAWSLNQRVAGRVVSIAWGPWTGAGMVSPELEREYVRRGIGLIDAERGIDCLLRELGDGRAADAQVIVVAADPRLVTARRPGALPPNRREERTAPLDG
jgi:NAD(P)-dependent dehydrogenase (short-subunit alcohol dehydrogenase family)